MQYDYQDVVKAVVRKISMVSPKSSKISYSLVMSNSYEAGFEDIICGWVDALELLRGIKNIKKKQIIGYKAMGYNNWEIAEILGVSEQAIKQNIARIKKYFKNIYTKFS